MGGVGRVEGGYKGQGGGEGENPEKVGEGG